MRKFTDIPYALRRQAVIRSGIAAIFLLVGILIWIFMKDVLMIIPCICIVVFMSVNVGRLLHDCYKGNYVVIVGECVDIEKSKIFKKLKTIRIDTCEGYLRIHIRSKLRGVVVGDKVTIYVAARTALYFYQGEYGLHDYYAIEIDMVKPV